MRSVDLCLGLPSDVVLYATLLILIARQTGYKPGMLNFMMGDSHVYMNHLDEWETYKKAETYELPSWTLAPLSNVDSFIPSHFELQDYEHGPSIKFALNV
jgi:thymidylate synthase